MTQFQTGLEVLPESIDSDVGYPYFLLSKSGRHIQKDYLDLDLACRLEGV